MGGVTEIVLFHHAQGLTPGVLAFADELRGAGYAVNTPDLYEGETFEALDAGLAHAEEIGFGNIVERGRLAVMDMQDGLVYAGFSLGVLPAQMLAQSRPGARGALLYHGCISLETLGGSWPEGVAVQIHGMEDDPIFSTEGDLDAAEELVETADNAELFLYPGQEHLFADASLPSYDPGAASLLLERTLSFLERVS
jgi:dienelactone hydrolase